MRAPCEKPCCSCGPWCNCGTPSAQADRREAERAYHVGRCEPSFGGCGDLTDRKDLNLQLCPDCAARGRS